MSYLTIMRLFSLVFLVCQLISPSKLIGDPSLERIWDSAEVRNRVGSVVLAFLALDEDKCWAKPTELEAERCIRKLFTDITRNVDELLSEKSKESDVSLIQLTSFRLGGFNQTIEEHIIERGVRMLPLLKFALDNSSCVLFSACQKPGERKLILGWLIQEILKKKLGREVFGPRIQDPQARRPL